MNLEPVTSRLLTGIGYDAATQTLRAQFANGSAHDYSGVSQADYDALRTADSVGSFFLKNIKPNFPSSRVDAQ